MQHHAFLNRNVVRCNAADAVFEHEQGKAGDFLPGTRQSLRMFDHEISKLAEDLAQQTPVNPVRSGKPSQTLELEGFQFSCVEPNQWECERSHCKVVLHAGADNSDTALILRNIYEIERKIFTRASSGPPIEFQIGVPQWPTHHHVACAITEPTHARILVFQTQSGGHILAAKIEQATEIKVGKILLHEIAHTLETLLSDHRENLRQTLHDDLALASEALKEISPHYLGKQLPAILKELDALKTLKASGKKEVLIQKDGKESTCNLAPYLLEKIRHLTEEVFAETVRHFYLEPCVSGKPPTPPNTGWEALDKLAGTLCIEAQKTISKPTEPSSGKFPNQLPKIHSNVGFP
jgi:hypothetical protein